MGSFVLVLDTNVWFCSAATGKKTGALLGFGFLNFFDFLDRKGEKSFCYRDDDERVITCLFTHLVEDLFQLLIGPLQVIVDDDHIKHPRLLTWRTALNQLLLFDSVACVCVCVCVTETH